MTSRSPDEERSAAPLEIPIEPLPTEPLVPRPDPAAASAPDDTVVAEPVTPETTQELVVPEPFVTEAVVPEAVVTEAVVGLPERDSAGRGALRPTTPQPARDEPARPRRSPRFTDRRHPIRGAAGLIALVLVGAIALAAALGAAVALVAFALRQTAG